MKPVLDSQARHSFEIGKVGGQEKRSAWLTSAVAAIKKEFARAPDSTYRIRPIGKTREKSYNWGSVAPTRFTNGPFAGNVDRLLGLF